MLIKLLRSLFKVFDKEKTGYTRRNFWGHSVRYNKYGEKVGWSRKNFWGGRNRYNKNDELTSYTMKNFWGGYNTYDPDGNLIKKSYKNFWGGHNTYDLNGNLEKQTVKNIWHGVDRYEGEANDSPTTIPKKSKSSAPIKKSVAYSAPKDTESHRTYEASSNRNTTTNAQKVTTPNPADLMPKIVIDKTVQFFDTIADAVDYYNVPDQYVKILVYEYGKLKEFPAIAYCKENLVYVAPLLVENKIIVFDKSEISGAQKVVIDNLSFEDLEGSFLELGVSKLGSEFEQLFPEFGFDGMVGSLMMYKLPCGLVITDRSLEELKNIL